MTTTEHQTENPYYIVRAEKGKVYQAQVVKIAEALGAAYVPFPRDLWDGGDLWGKIQLPTGETISLVSTHRGRIEVSGHWPKDAKGQVYCPRAHDKSQYKSITVSRDRSPEQIAADIQRRLIPAYLAEHAKQAAQAAAADVYETNRQHSLFHLAQIAGVAASKTDKRFSLDFTSGWGSVEVSDDTASLELRSLPIDQAAQILKLVRSFNEKE